MYEDLYEIFNDTFPSVFPVFVTSSSVEEDLVYDEEYGVQVFALSPITSGNGLKGILLDILGDYDGIVVQYRYQSNTSTNYTYVNEIQPDYPWLASAVLFISLLWSLFMVGGRLLRTR